MKRRGGLPLFLTVGLVVGVLVSVAPTAQAAGATRRLTVTKAQIPASSGAGGTITSTSSPTQTTQVNCGVSPLCTTQTVSFTRYTTVTITAVPTEATSTLVGFSSNCPRNGSTNTCTISALASDTTVTVTFARKQTLTATQASPDGGGGTITGGAGTAFVTAYPGGCTSATCTANETYNTSIALTATANATSRFMGWSGCGSTSGAGGSVCSVTMSGAKGVTANFLKTYELTAAKGSTGSGAGTLTAAGVPCSPSCTSRSISSESVTLVATPSAGSVFSGWEGTVGTCTTATTCTLLMDRDRTDVVARFTSLKTLTVTVEGSGSLTSSTAPTSGSISNCTATCSAQYPYGTTVTLSASSPESARLGGWIGCTPIGGLTGSTCSITLSGDPAVGEAVTATFGALNKLQVTKTATGGGGAAGTVTATGIDCGSDCYQWFDPDTEVVLTAVPDAGSRFGTWSGPCAETDLTTPTCTVTLSATSSVTADFVKVWDLTLGAVGAGAFGGSVAAGLVTVGCAGDACVPGASSGSITYDHGTSVTVIADPDEDTYVTWSGDIGACGIHDTECTVTMDQARTITATFAQIEFAVTVAIAGSGEEFGSVLSAPSGIGCPDDCSGSFGIHAEVVLTAGAATGARFDGWTGPCTEAVLTGDTCTVKVEDAIDVIATFVALHDLTVVVDPGDGAGAVTSDVGGIDCGSACVATYDEGDDIVLTATPDEISRIISWSGVCTGSATTCTVSGIDEATSVTVTFALKIFTLSVARTGTGSIVSDISGIDGAGGIDCGSICSEVYLIDTVVTLTPVFDADAVRFDGWGGACEGAPVDGCEVTMTQAKYVSAAFVTIWDLSVTAAYDGDGVGTVTSDVGGIDCPTTCIATYDEGDDIVLTATPDERSRIVSWSGVCVGSATTCTVSDIDAATSVTVTFALKAFTLSVTRTGTGSITSDTGGIDCGSTCSGTYLIDTVVTLTPVFDPDAVRFDGWGGACSGTGTCEVTMTQAKSVSAAFVTVWDLSVTATDDGTGTGTVTGTGGIDCPSSCTATYDTGTSVTLQANPGANSMVGSWSGATCSGTGATCTVTMDQARSVTVTFTKLVYPLSLTKISVGGGTGTVAIAADSYVCDAACTTFTRSYEPGSTVTLSATPSAGSWFVGWGGACLESGRAGTCTVTVTAATSVTATFETMPVLTVAKAGIGSGTVTWTDPAGDHIDCGVDCTTAVITNTEVTLVATPLASNGSSVASWSIRACGTALTCTVTMSASTTVTVTFTAPAAYISLSKTALYSGSGSVVTQPTGISCAASCTKTQTGTYANFATVTLTATPSNDSYIVGWGQGQCDYVSPDLRNCVVTLGAAGTTRPVSVTFARPQLSLSKQSISQGRGSVSGPNLNCGNTCNSRTVVYTPGQTVTLTATPASGAVFVRWAGDGSCSGSATTCTVTMDRARSVTAVFGQGILVSVSKTGSGLVYWAGNSDALNCGDVCATAVASGTTVTLVASPTSGWLFVRWDGTAACSTDQFCTVAVTATTNVTAVFEPDPFAA